MQCQTGHLCDIVDTQTSKGDSCLLSKQLQKCNNYEPLSKQHCGTVLAVQKGEWNDSWGVDPGPYRRLERGASGQKKLAVIPRMEPVCCGIAIGL